MLSVEQIHEYLPLLDVSKEARFPVSWAGSFSGAEV